MNMMSTGLSLAGFARLAPQRNYPPEVLLAAKKSLIDWLGVCLGARNEPPARIAQQVMREWGTQGRAPLLTGGHAAPAASALVNGTLSHCLDYDDTHVGSVFHASGPIWAAALATAAEHPVSETVLLSAVISAFEAGVKLGSGGLGLRLNGSGWHATGTLGVVAAALASSIVLGLSEDKVTHALATAASQASGLTASFGTMAKPLHVGKAAMDGILSAQLAAHGFRGAPGVFDAADGLFATLLQDKEAIPVMAEQDGEWEILRNSFKPYAACQLTHAAIDCALALAPGLKDRPVQSIRAHVHPLAIKIAGIMTPTTPTEGKFSLPYCIALGLNERQAEPKDFTTEALADAELRHLASRVELVSDITVDRVATRLEVLLEDGEEQSMTVHHALGNPENPMDLPALERKFLSMVRPVLGERAQELLTLCTNFEQLGSLPRLLAILGELPEITQ